MSVTTIPELEFTENHASGWTKFEFYGDKELATKASNVWHARKLLANVRNRQSGGGTPEEAGFYSGREDFGNGVRAHAMVNGQNSIVRVYADPPPKSEGEEKKKREDDFEPGDYLWIGLRMKPITRPIYALECWLVEPGGGAYRGIVGANYANPSNFIDQTIEGRCDGSDELGWTVQRGGVGFGNDAESLDSMVAAFQAAFGDGYAPGLALGDHQQQATFYLNGVTTFGESDSVQVNFSANGVMFQYAPTNNMDFTDFSRLYGGTYDPLMSRDENNGVGRDVTGRSQFDGEAVERGGSTAIYGWDAVFWIDPYDEKMLAKYPTVKNVDKRPLMREVRSLLKADGFILPPRQQVKPGTYVLVVRAWDRPPSFISTRGGETIPPPAGTLLGSGFDKRSQYCDYTERMAEIGNWPPLEVEAEVRIGRKIYTMREGMPDPDEISLGLPSAKFNFDLTCASYDERMSVAEPFGRGEFDSCSADGGPNMGGPSFAQAVLIDVKGKRAELGELSVASPVFDAGEWVPYREFPRMHALFFVYVTFPPPTVEEWQAQAGIAVHTGMEFVTNGSYGCSEMGEISSAALQALFATTSQIDGVWMFDAVTHELTCLGPPTSTPDTYAAYDPPLFSDNYYWYYEKAVAYQNACYATYGIAVTSGSYFFEFSQNHLSDPNFTNPDCCAAG